MKSDAKEIGKRIEQVAQIVGGKRELSRRVSLSESQIHRYIKGENTPGLDAIVDIANAGDVSVEWLITGREAMKPVSNSSSDTTGTYAVARLNKGDFDGNIKQLEMGARVRSLLADQLDIPEDDIRMVVVFDDAMSPTLQKDDVVFIDAREGQSIREGIYAIHLEHDHRIFRRLQVLPGGNIRASADNKYYSDFTFTPDEFSDVAVEGRVIQYSRPVA